ncbi:hypothetical protein [Streptomyces indicus]|uniref:PH domain-containing protein n=1 Tax=Streptomyces indicus TaxID=417292 RepID=A0A1G9GRA8_9ACTN|nr:hypothetical protein [Streptomyces indicus]SDL03055.1 hypothetical protein SAMN05421806_116157 [Streptomyces indicus]
MRANVVRRPLFTWIGLTPAVGFYACAIYVAAFLPEDGYAPPLAIAAFTFFFWLLGWHSAIRFTATHLSVTNIVVTSTVEWSDVRRVIVHDGLGIELRDGRELGSIAFGGSLIGTFSGYPTYQTAYRTLQKARKKAQHRERHGGPVRVRWSIDWRRQLTAAAAIYGPLLLLLALRG